ncbi:TetR/AcrR family transcriptional regulator [Leeia sp. TBRC 13508]|uniref:TetR/AcrR family transcriptional regulator n=1 Tax=Leeia speluncae TaxID=2884804 RepID=A0ABS8D1J1_9NEIS|nr:TetR/AcrR family transcriptional regulator [Leeia speluncae]MCB6182052.1 TetR/AcrR family transcriptional regulator [Leeia speluncae]
MGTRENIVEAGLAAIIQQGYDGMGLEDILKTANASKGSFYHFFKSKDNLVLAIIEEYESFYTHARKTLLSSSDVSPKQRIHNYLLFLVEDQRAHEMARGCLYGMLAQSANARSDSVRQKLDQIFTDWRTHLETEILAAQSANELATSLTPADAADFVICAYEGALIKFKVDRNITALEKFVDGCMRFLFGQPA